MGKGQVRGIQKMGLFAWLNLLDGDIMNDLRFLEY